MRISNSISHYQKEARMWCGLHFDMVSSELPELIGTCDRICVMNEGRITGELQKDEFSEETIMRYATM